MKDHYTTLVLNSAFAILLIIIELITFSFEVKATKVVISKELAFSVSSSHFSDKKANRMIMKLTNLSLRL